MAEVDAELVERVARWCAEAGRQAGAAEIRHALAPLSWDQLLAARALLADPPPVRPLGPYALADLARGAAPDIAAEREREGRYRPEAEEAREAAKAEAPPAAGAAPAPAPSSRRRRMGPSATVVIRRARDRAEPAPIAPAAQPLLDELQLPEGRAVLERLVRAHGGRRPAIVAALAAGWRRAGGGPIADAELDALLELHGLARAFVRRERDELLHALRAAGGVRATAAERVGLHPDALVAALARLGATADAERIRAERRAELRARTTLAERVRLLLSDELRLDDLGLRAEFENDLRGRLPEHLRALRAGRTPLLPALAASLSATPAEMSALAARLGIELDSAPAGAAPAPGAPSRERAYEGGSSRRPAAPARSGPRAFGPRPSGPRPSGPRPSGPRPSGPRPSGARSSGPRSSGPRPSGPRSSGPRPSGPRSSGPRPTGARPPRSGPRPGGGGHGAGRRPPR